MKIAVVWNERNKSLMFRAGLIFGIAYLLLGGFSIYRQPAGAANPTGGTLNAGAADGANTTWTGTLSGAPPAGQGESTCVATVAAAGNCDDYTLTIGGQKSDWIGKKIVVTFDWTAPSTDYDMVIRQETNNIAGLQGDGVYNMPTPTPPVGATPTPTPTALDGLIGTSGNGTNTHEEVVINPSATGTGIYYVRSVYFAANPADQYLGKATVIVPTVEPGSTLMPSACALPTFDNYQPPVGFNKRDSSAEPSIGVNWNTGNILTMSRLNCNRTALDDSTSPADPTKASWFSQTSPTIATGLDPILFTDPITGRTICGELVAAGGATDGGISDDDLATFTATFQTGEATQGADHQTIGGGPPNPNITARQPTTVYPHLFYYASQQIAYGAVATSFDGGLSYEPAIPAYTLAQCGGLHGHIKVAPDGTVYLPNKGCGGKVGLATSEDNGLNWSVRTIPTSTSGKNDPSVGIGAGGRLFVGYTSSDNHPHVSVSDDKGLTWRNDFDLSGAVSPGLKAAVFPEVVAGDNNRAAVFFLATNSTDANNPVGDDNGAAGPNYKGTWYPYMATTCDGGKTWSVVRADNDPLHPGAANPVQQGVICTNGTTCPAGPPATRNLADFNEIAVDSRGRIVAVYADGCNFGHPCININDNSGDRNSNQGTATVTIIRQRGGMRLFSAYDVDVPGAPTLSSPVYVEQNAKGGNQVKWTTPDDNGAPLLSYRIYRGSEGGSEQQIAEVKADGKTFSFNDRSGKGSKHYYRVTAVNKFGESPRNVKSFAEAR